MPKLVQKSQMTPLEAAGLVEAAKQVAEYAARAQPCGITPKQRQA